ncbi:conserved hypothetical protein [Ricinus communis]|uniref:DUF4408 domain-containing protein n=1 Tax=Ricinus communis TaxID=3988 RepID=B9RAC1_RICCO|nr:conserved hypothetical protein [Ricinus communis]
MDLIQLQKIHAINKSKRHQLLDISSIKLFLFISLPKISSTLLNSKIIFIVGNLIIILLIGESKFFTSNSIPAATDAYYNEYVNRKRGLRNSSTLEEKKATNTNTSFKENASKSCEGVKKIKVEVWDEGNSEVAEKEREDLDGEEEISLPAEELNKRADDFIARVNRQRMQEARLLLC